MRLEPIVGDGVKLNIGLQQVKNLAKRAETTGDEQLMAAVAPMLERASSASRRVSQQVQQA